MNVKHPYKNENRFTEGEAIGAATPQALFTVAVDGATVNVQNFSVAATSFLWRFGDGTESTALDPMPHEYAAAGQYTIRLEINGNPSLFYEELVNVSDPVGEDRLSGMALTAAEGAEMSAMQGLEMDV